MLDGMKLGLGLKKETGFGFIKLESVKQTMMIFQLQHQIIQKLLQI